MLAQFVKPLRDSVAHPSPAAALDRFVVDGVRYEFALDASREQRQPSRLMSRLARTTPSSWRSRGCSTARGTSSCAGPAR